MVGIRSIRQAWSIAASAASSVIPRRRAVIGVLLRVAGAGLGRCARTARADQATMARAASGRSLLLVLSPACGECVDTGSMASVLVTAASSDRA
jgi:hypothetical protein